MPQDYAASVQGVSLRVTRLDASGSLMTGPMDSYTTSAFIRVSFTPEYEEGDEITEKAADGTVCISFKAPDTIKRVNMEIAVCEPDAELSALMSGGLLLAAENANGKNISVGWASAQVGEDPSGNGVAVEVWSRAIQNGKPAGENPFFHWVFPYVKTRLSGDRVIENGLLATTFEGFGLGNTQFRSGIDAGWRWPAATDRPYMYARSSWAPQGLKGFYLWTPAAEAADAPTSATAGDEVVDSVAPGFNVPGGTDPYPYNAARPTDPVLSAADYEAGAPDPGAAVWKSSAADEDVANPHPDSDDLSVTYLARGDAAALEPTGVTAGAPGEFTPPGSTVPGTLAALKAHTAVGDGPYSGAAWTTGQYVTLGDSSHAFWDGTEWLAGEAP